MKKTLLIVLAVASVQFSYGWGKNGHLITGKLADQYLTPKTRDAVKAILGDESIGEAGLWLDSEINESKHKNQDHWHYSYVDATLDENALIVLPQFVENLQNPQASQEAKLKALRSIIHIAGDIHVPLHCGYKKDAGGHKPKIGWEGEEEKTNLHKVWDTDMILRYNSEVDSYVTELQGKITSEEKEMWATTDFSVWVKESQEMLDQAYDFDGKVLTNEYYEQNIVLVNDRLSMSGIRLAALLNSIFDPQE